MLENSWTLLCTKQYAYTREQVRLEYHKRMLSSKHYSQFFSPCHFSSLPLTLNVSLIIQRHFSPSEPLWPSPTIRCQTGVEHCSQITGEQTCSHARWRSGEKREGERGRWAARKGEGSVTPPCSLQDRLARHTKRKRAPKRTRRRLEKFDRVLSPPIAASLPPFFFPPPGGPSLPARSFLPTCALLSPRVEGS